MRKAHMVGGGVKKDKLTENEYLIYTLAVLPELVFCHGFGILKNIYEGTFDEADLGNEQIPEWYQSKIRLETLSGEFFRDLLFVFYLVDDFEYICNRLFFYIKAQSCPEQKRMNMLLQYYGVRYLLERKMPWEIESRLWEIAGEKRDVEDIIFIYQRDAETMAECVRRLRRGMCALNKSSQNFHKEISTHLLTVLTISVILQLEQRKGVLRKEKIKW